MKKTIKTHSTEIIKPYRQVRENVRNAVRHIPLKYNTLEEALARIASQFSIPLKRWVESSKLLQDALFQKKITEYFRKG